MFCCLNCWQRPALIADLHCRMVGVSSKAATEGEGSVFKGDARTNANEPRIRGQVSVMVGQFPLEHSGELGHDAAQSTKHGGRLEGRFGSNSDICGSSGRVGFASESRPNGPPAVRLGGAKSGRASTIVSKSRLTYPST